MTDAHPEGDNAENYDSRMRFNELVIEHQSRIRSYLSSIGVAVSSIDDIAQEALVIAYKKFDNYEEGTSFPAWVNSIARNLAWNDQRKTSRRFKLLNERMTNFLDEQVSPEVTDQDEGDDGEPGPE